MKLKNFKLNLHGRYEAQRVNSLNKVVLPFRKCLCYHKCGILSLKPMYSAWFEIASTLCTVANNLFSTVMDFKCFLLLPTQEKEFNLPLPLPLPKKKKKWLSHQKLIQRSAWGRLTQKGPLASSIPFSETAGWWEAGTGHWSSGIIAYSTEFLNR